MATESKDLKETTTTVSQGQTDPDSSTVLALEGMTCASCAMRIEKGLKKVPGVKEASVNLATEQATVTYDAAQTGLEQMIQKVEAIGYKAVPLIPSIPTLSPQHADVNGETQLIAELDVPVPSIPQEDERSQSSVDESMITGESILIEKAPADKLIGATINQHGVLHVRATKVGADTVLASIIRLVEEAQGSKAPIQRLADSISSIFVPAVLIIALLTFIGWAIIGQVDPLISMGGMNMSGMNGMDMGVQYPWVVAFIAAMSVLVIACPCALGLATPTAIIVGTGKGAELGILIKGGESLERIQAVHTVLLDKTGTITKGKPELTDVITLPGKPSNEVLRLVAEAEQGSEHPLATAIVEGARARGLTLHLTPEHVVALTGRGLEATVEGYALLLVVYSVLLDWLHLLGAALWIGSMLYITASYLPVLKSSPPVERARSLIRTLSRYSLFAITGVIIIAITGPFNATVHMNSWNQLLTTPYGRALVVKALLVVTLLLIAVIEALLFRPQLATQYKKYLTATDAVKLRTATGTNRLVDFTAQQVKRLEERVSRASSRLMSVLRWESLLGVAIILCSGMLTVFAGTLSPATAQTQPTTQSKPFHTTVLTTDHTFTVEFDVSPNRFGTNLFMVSVLDSKGIPDTHVAVSLTTTMLDMDMGTNRITLQPDGKGHLSAQGVLSMGGNWQIRILIRTPDGTLHIATVKFFTPF